MLTKLSRYLLIFITILVTAIYIPKLYWLVFGERIVPPHASYSPVIKKFILGKLVDKNYLWMDSDGKRYTREQTDLLLPLQNYRLLAAKGQMPDTLDGIPISVEEVRLNSFYLRFQPYQIGMPQIQLFPLFESNPPRLQLEMPPDFFRITGRMEFITAESNQINSEKTGQFTERLREIGFAFPAVKIFGNPTTRKPFDEGYFVVDNAGQLFHIKMRNGKPLCIRTPVPTDLGIETIFVKESNLKEFMAVIITRSSDVYLLMYDHYKLQKLPLAGYDFKNDQLRIVGNLFYRILSVVSDGRLEVTVTDRNYEVIDRYEETWPTQDQRTAGLASAWVFPFTLKLQSGKSMFIGFYWKGYHWNALLLNLALVALSFFLYRKRNNSIKNTIPDRLLVTLTGIYGFIALLIFPNHD